MTKKPINLSKYIDKVENFPRSGVTFYDVSPLLASPKAFHETINQLASKCPKNFDAIIAVEARGFLFASALAFKLNKPLIMVRKPKKLPHEVITFKYELEYGSSELEIMKKSITPNKKYVIVDDVLAIGGTASAVSNLVNSLGGIVQKLLFVLEISGLGGRELFDDRNDFIDVLLTTSNIGF